MEGLPRRSSEVEERAMKWYHDRQSFWERAGAGHGVKLKSVVQDARVGSGLVDDRIKRLQLFVGEQ